MKPLTPWLPDDRLPELGCPPLVLNWLRETGSITQRLRLGHPGLQVQVLGEGVGPPLPDEWAALGAQAAQPCWVREVRLHDAGQPLVHARTVVPAWGPTNPWHVLQALGQRPLGELLFSLPGLVREPFCFALTQAEGAAVGADGAGAAVRSVRPTRRARHVRAGAVLLLTEAFEGMGVCCGRSPLALPAPLWPPP